VIKIFYPRDEISVHSKEFIVLVALSNQGRRDRWGTGVLGYWGIEVLGYWGIEVLGYWGTEVLGYWGTGVLRYWGTGVLGYWGTHHEWKLREKIYNVLIGIREVERERERERERPFWRL
jgi:hypothetical protein